MTTFIIPSINRKTLKRAVDSAEATGATVSILLDIDRVGESTMRNELAKQAKTPWLSYLDDDDTITSDYVERLEEEIANHPEADVIHFRQYFCDTGHILPTWPEVTWGNIGIAFSVKKDIALKYPFQTEEHEDYKFIKRIQEAGHNIHFSKYITYRVRH